MSGDLTGPLWYVQGDCRVWGKDSNGNDVEGIVLTRSTTLRLQLGATRDGYLKTITEELEAAQAEIGNLRGQIHAMKMERLSEEDL